MATLSYPSFVSISSLCSPSFGALPICAGVSENCHGDPCTFNVSPISGYSNSLMYPFATTSGSFDASNKVLIGAATISASRSISIQVSRLSLRNNSARDSNSNNFFPLK